MLSNVITRAERQREITRYAIPPSVRLEAGRIPVMTWYPSVHWRRLGTFGILNLPASRPEMHREWAFRP